jgi:predicted MFS family arabinose efflux permease
MKNALFPFRWLDEKIQGVVDRTAFRLMDRLRCERRVLTLMLSLIAVTAFVPIMVSVLTMQDSSLSLVLTTLCMGYGGWCMLTMHTVEDRSIHHWRHYILARVVVAVMKLAIVGGLIAGAIAVLRHPYLSAPVGASACLAALSLMASLYLQRTPLSRPVEKAAEPVPAPTSASADF